MFTAVELNNDRFLRKVQNMTLGLKILCGIWGVLMMSIGGRWWLAFDSVAVDWAVQALGPLGVNNLIADMGGLFMGGAIMIALGLRAGHSSWLLASALLNAVAAAGRLFGYVVWEYVPETLISVFLEIVAVLLLAWTHHRMTKEQAES